MAEYRPGVCNIGRREQRKRLFTGFVGFAAAIVWVGLVLGVPLPTGYLLATFVPLLGGFVGWFQARFRFCVAFAALARYDLAGSGGGAGSVLEADAHRRDRRRALQITAYAAASAAVVTAVLYAVAVGL